MCKAAQLYLPNKKTNKQNNTHYVASTPEAGIDEKSAVGYKAVSLILTLTTLCSHGSGSAMPRSDETAVCSLELNVALCTGTFGP